MAIMVVSLGFIYGRIFKADINDFIPSLCAGLLVLGFLSSALWEGTLFSYIK
jgi:lipopolysaccharide transport system permease protein